MSGTGAATGPGTGPPAGDVVDCDVHNEVPGLESLLPYLPAYWVEQFENTVFRGPTDSPYPANSPVAIRAQSRREDGRPPDLDDVRREVLDAPDVTAAILSCTYGVDSLHNPDHAAALASAVNDWQVAEWLDRDPRLRASVVVASQIPSLAAAEIDRVGAHPGFVQVLLPARSPHPYGSRIYHPLWEAVDRQGLVGGIHFGGAPGNPTSAVGWPTYYVEEYAGMALVFASQLSSLIFEGVFDLLPDLRVSLLESGFTWLPAHMWRIDKEWKNLRRLVPWVRRPPTDYIHDHVRVSLQPLDSPGTVEQLLEVVEQLESDELLMYASSYPHQHARDPAELLDALPAEHRQRVRAGNARSWYRLPDPVEHAGEPAAEPAGRTAGVEEGAVT